MTISHSGNKIYFLSLAWNPTSFCSLLVLCMCKRKQSLSWSMWIWAVKAFQWCSLLPCISVVEMNRNESSCFSFFGYFNCVLTPRTQIRCSRGERLSCLFYILQGKTELDVTFRTKLWRTCQSMWHFSVYISWGSGMPSDTTELVQVCNTTAISRRGV